MLKISNLFQISYDYYIEDACILCFLSLAHQLQNLLLLYISFSLKYLYFLEFLFKLTSILWCVNQHFVDHCIFLLVIAQANRSKVIQNFVTHILKKVSETIIISHQNIFGKNLTCILWCGTQKIVKFKRIFFEKCLRRKRI